MWSAHCWVRKGCENLQWGDLSPWTSMSPGTPGDPCTTALVCIYEICFLQIFMNEWEVVLFIISEVKDFTFSSEGLRNAGPDWTVNLGGFMEDWAYLAVLAYFIRKVFLPHIELGALKIKEEGISEYIYSFLGFFGDLISDSIKCWEGSIVPGFAWQDINVIQKVTTQLIWPPN